MSSWISFMKFTRFTHMQNLCLLTWFGPATAQKTCLGSRKLSWNMLWLIEPLTTLAQKKHRCRVKWFLMIQREMYCFLGFINYHPMLHMFGEVIRLRIMLWLFCARFLEKSFPKALTLKNCMALDTLGLSNLQQWTWMWHVKTSG